MASGWSIGEVFQATHWDATRLELANYVRFRYDVLLDPAADGVLPVQSLRQGIPRDVNWSTQISGIEIAEEAASIVERLWAAHRRLPTTPATAELAALEGEFRRTLVTHYRREGQLRDAKLAEARRNGGRLEREVPGCGFSFGSVYGALGADYAHVHHLDPLGGGPERVTRLNRLVVVCANCHAMIHRGGRCRDYRTLINDQPAE